MSQEQNLHLDKDRPIFVRANDELRADVELIREDAPGLSKADAVRIAVHEAAAKRRKGRRSGAK
jgi:hypothetical protein